MRPDTIFPQSFNYNWSPRYLYNMEGRNWLIQFIYTLLHQQGKILNAGWQDTSQQYRHPRMLQVPCSSNIWKLVSVASAGKCPLYVQCSINELESFTGTSRQRTTDLDQSCAVSSAPIFSSQWSTCNRIITVMSDRHIQKWLQFSHKK